MKNLILFSIIVLTILSTVDCRTAKVINKAISTRDTTSTTIIKNRTGADSLAQIAAINATKAALRKNYIDFKTFNAKIKVEYQDTKGKQPDVTAVVRIVKDSAIWISLSATLFNIEVYRVLITKDSVIVMDTRNKEVQYRSLDYLQDVTDIPFDYTTLQDLLVGNPIFLDSNIVSYKKTDNNILIASAGQYFKNLLTLDADDFSVTHSKLDDIDVARNRTADITYSYFDNKAGYLFSTYREITVAEKNRLDIHMNFKQYEFNKELSVSFKVPKNYKRK